MTAVFSGKVAMVAKGRIRRDFASSLIGSEALVAGPDQTETCNSVNDYLEKLVAGELETEDHSFSVP